MKNKRFSPRALILSFTGLVALIAILIGGPAADERRLNGRTGTPAEPPRAESTGTGGAAKKAFAIEAPSTGSESAAPAPTGAKKDVSTVGPETAPSELSRPIVALLQGNAALSAVVERFRPALARYYDDDTGAALWGAPERKTALIERLGHAEQDGLNPSDYPISDLVMRLQSADDADSAARAETEVVFSAALLAYASDLKVGRLRPRKVDPELFAQTRTIDGAAVLSALAARPDLDAFFSGWAPHNPEYRALRGVLSDYRKIAAAGGWPKLPSGKTLEPGMRDPRVGQIRDRLKISGDITIVGGDADFFDPALVMAVERFQKRHGLKVDGIVGPDSFAALNVPVTERIRQIILNMERWRWLPEDLGDRYILVNIAGFKLTLVEDGGVVERMAVVVGRPYRQTPVFSDRVRYLEFNPYWTVPFKLAVEDELPKLKKDPGFLADHGFEVFLHDKPVDPAAIDWSKYTKRTFPFTLRQKPGPDNALGQVKFMFPNRFDVYLHDTPARELFVHPERAFSSGCIRLERPIDLAVWALRGTPGWDHERIAAQIASRRNMRADLAEPLPIYLIYATAWSGEDGIINFRPDIYGRDKRLHEALFGN